jgi:hypothetical protein
MVAVKIIVYDAITCSQTVSMSLPSSKSHHLLLASLKPHLLRTQSCIMHRIFPRGVFFHEDGGSSFL